MKHVRTALTVWLSFTAWLGSGQTISPSVISTAGGLGINAAGTLSYTVGEMAMIETYATTSHFLTQGFQQPWELITSIDEDRTSVGIISYPNPASDYFYVRIDADRLQALQVRVTDVMGKWLSQTPFELTGPTTIRSFDAGHLPAGIYMVTISSAPGALSPIQPVTTKIQIAH